MLEIEKSEFVTRIKGMSTEELEIVVEQIPVELCLDRIRRELDKSKIFTEAIHMAITNNN